MSTCNDCPFKCSTPLDGSPDWLADVINLHRSRNGMRHSCHKTDPQADGFTGGVKKDCAGYRRILLNDFKKTPGKGGVWKSINHMVLAYLKHWNVDDPRIAKVHLNEQGGFQ